MKTMKKLMALAGAAIAVAVNAASPIEIPVKQVTGIAKSGDTIMNNSFAGAANVLDQNAGSNYGNGNNNTISGFPSTGEGTVSGNATDGYAVKMWTRTGVRGEWFAAVVDVSADSYSKFQLTANLPDKAKNNAGTQASAFNDGKFVVAILGKDSEGTIHKTSQEFARGTAHEVSLSLDLGEITLAKVAVFVSGPKTGSFNDWYEVTNLKFTGESVASEVVTISGNSTWTSTALAGNPWVNSTAEEKKNVTLSVTADADLEVQCTGDTKVVAGNVDVSGEGKTLNMTGDALTILDGTLSVEAGATLKPAKLVFEGKTAITAAGTIDLTGAEISVASGGTLRIAPALLDTVKTLTVASDAAIDLGTLSADTTITRTDLGGCTVKFSGDNIARTLTLPANFTGTANAVSGQFSLGSSSIGRGSYLIGKGVNVQSEGNLTKEVANNVTFEGASELHVNSGGTLEISGAVTVNEGATLTKKGSGALKITDTGSVTVNGTFIYSDGTVTGKAVKLAGSGAVNLAGHTTIGSLAVAANAKAKVNLNNTNRNLKIGKISFDDASATLTIVDLTCDYVEINDIDGAGKLIRTKASPDTWGSATVIGASGTPTGDFTGTIEINNGGNTVNYSQVLFVENETILQHATVDLNGASTLSLTIANTKIGALAATNANPIVVSCAKPTTYVYTNTTDNAYNYSTKTTDPKVRSYNTNDATARTLEIGGSGAFEGKVGDAANAGSVKIAVGGSGAQTLSGACYFGASTVAAGGALDLSGASVAETAAIANAGTVTVSTDTVFNLDTLTATANKYTVIDGGTVSNWGELSGKNFTQFGSELPDSSIASLDPAGTITIAEIAGRDLTWGGAATGDWTTNDTVKVWTADGSAAAFATGDNVTFNTADAAVTLAEDITAGDMTVSQSVGVDVGDNKLFVKSAAVNAGTLTLDGIGNSADKFTVRDHEIKVSADASVQFNDSIPNANRKVVGVAEEGFGTVVLSRSTGNELFIGDANAITGAVKLVKKGGVKVTINENQGYTGGTKLEGGNLGFATAGALGTGDIELAGGALVLHANGAVTLANKVMASGNAAINTQASTINLNSPLVISEGATLTKDGSGTLTLGNSVTVNGALARNEGTVTMTATATNPLTLGENFTKAELSNLFLENGGKVVQNGGVVTLANQLMIHNKANDNFDSYTVSNGVVNVNNKDGASNQSAVVIGHWPGANNNRNHHATLAAGENGVVNVPDGQIQVNWDSSGKLSVAGGEVNAKKINGNNNDRQRPSGSVEVTEGGRVNLGSGGLAVYGTFPVTVNGGTFGALDNWSTAASIKIGGEGLAFDTQKRVISADGASTQGADGATITINYPLGNAAESVGSLTKVGLGTLVLSTTNTYTGATLVQDGILRLGNMDTLAASSEIEVQEGATLDIPVTAPLECGRIANGKFKIPFEGSVMTNGVPLKSHEFIVTPHGISIKRPLIIRVR